jgi:hypothetical protein
VKEVFMKLNVKAFGLTCGLTWGLGLFCLTWWIIAFEGSNAAVLTFIGHVYRGYTITPLGSVIGMVWGFFDAGIGGLIFAWLYNFLADRMK